MKIPHDRWPRLLALAAHELRTPAGVVSGYTRMLLQGRAGGLPDAQRAMLEAAGRSNDRLAELLDQMSELAHLEDGSATLATTAIDLAALASPADPAAPGPTVLPPLPAARLRADAARLRRALGATAALHRRKGTAEVALAARADEDALWLAVGAADAARDAVTAAPAALEPFDDLEGGLGLELTLARVVVERHGGAIFTRPGPGPDRQVTVIRLPLAEAG